MGGVVRYRPAVEADLDACTRIWKAGIDDYQGRLNQPPMPEDLAPLRRLLAHALATDADRFWVATVGDGTASPARCVGFTSATVRGDLWFLAMLFVEPSTQAGGIGSALLDRALAGGEPADGRLVDPGASVADGPLRRWGTCTDAAQPISNGLYARRGIVPRIPIWGIVGEVRRPAALPSVPNGLEVVPFEAIADGSPDGHRRLADAVNRVDREVLALEHAQDHAFCRREGRIGLLARDRDGRPLGYAYGSGIGRLGPVAAVDPELLPALLGAAIRETRAPGPVAAWIPGSAGSATRALLAAGLRMEGFPGLLCWSSAATPFERYVPISLAIL
jgi:GNAT superfamily N-acetyltransferase